MWLLPPDFPDDAFDLPPGAWELPWYADDEHIATLMTLLLRGVASLKEWSPVPWTAVEGLKATNHVREGAALIVRAPQVYDPNQVAAIARRLGWSYVFWQVGSPNADGQWAWLEREIKGHLVSELHRGTKDASHPWAMMGIESLPIRRASTMTTDPVELMQLLELASIHRFEHQNDGMRREDYDYSLQWAAGQRLAVWIKRIAKSVQADAVRVLVYQGRRGEERGHFRQVAQALQQVGLGLLVGEEFAASPLARQADEAVVRGVLGEKFGIQDNYNGGSLTIEVQDNKACNVLEKSPPIRVAGPGPEILPSDLRARVGWLYDFIQQHKDEIDVFFGAQYILIQAFFSPRRRLSREFARDSLAVLTASTPRSFEAQRVQDLLHALVELIMTTGPTSIMEARQKVYQLAEVVDQFIQRDQSKDEFPLYETLDILLAERALLWSRLIKQDELRLIADDARARPQLTPLSWLDAGWATIAAETIRLQGQVTKAISAFDRASQLWAKLGDEGRTGWVQTMVFSAIAAYESGQKDNALQRIDLIDDDEDIRDDTTIYAEIPLIRGRIALSEGGPREAVGWLNMARERFKRIEDDVGANFTDIALAEAKLALQQLGGLEDLLTETRERLGKAHDTRGRTYAELVLGDLALQTSRIDMSRACYREARRLAEYTGDRLAETTALHKLAHLETQMHRYDVASNLEEQARAIEVELNLKTAGMETEQRIKQLAAFSGETDDALT